MGTDFEKKNSNLFGDTVDFTSSPPYLGQDCMQSPFNWYVAIQSPALTTKKNPQMRKNPQNPHPCNARSSPSSPLLEGFVYMPLRGNPFSPGIGKLEIPSVYISLSPWLRDEH